MEILVSFCFLSKDRNIVITIAKISSLLVLHNTSNL